MLKLRTGDFMVQIGVGEARSQMIALLDRVLAGEHVVLLKGEEEVAHMVPVRSQLQTEAEREQALLAAERIRARGAALGVQFDWNEFKQLRDEGRR